MIWLQKKSKTIDTSFCRCATESVVASSAASLAYSLLGEVKPARPGLVHLSVTAGESCWLLPLYRIDTAPVSSKCTLEHSFTYSRSYWYQDVCHVLYCVYVEDTDDDVDKQVCRETEKVYEVTSDCKQVLVQIWKWLLIIVNSSRSAH